MGRLRKAKIDMIGKLRKDGYTQVETAEKTGVHLKTVQKYDPLKRPGKAASTRATRSVSKEDLEFRLTNLGNWINSIHATFIHKLDIKLICPACFKSYLELDDNEPGSTYVCKKCHYKIPFPSYDSWQWPC